MAVSTAQMYVLASGLVLLIVAIICAYLVWYCYWRKRQGNGFKKIPSRDQSHHQPVVKTPKIDINTVKFTLPYTSSRSASDIRPSSWAGSNNVDYTQDPQLVDYNLSKSSKSEMNLGLLKPELYVTNEDDDFDLEEDFPVGNIGRVWFALEYDAASEKLIVTVDSVKNLPGRQQRTSLAVSSSASSCDPFLRLYLLPDEKRYLQSKMKRKTRNPTFKETFMFTMSYSLLAERTLRITVFDVDRFMRQTIIGHVLFPLAELDITKTNDVRQDIEKSSQICSGSGGIQVGLTYFPNLNRVAVNVIRGKQIGNEDTSLPDSYVKITYSVLSKVHKVKKTNVQKSANEPFYNQTIEFKIDQSGMDVACLNFEVFHNTSGIGKSDKSLGSFIVGGSLVARGKELEHWTNMTQKPQTVAKEWHQLKIH